MDRPLLENAYCFVFAQRLKINVDSFTIPSPAHFCPNKVKFSDACYNSNKNPDPLYSCWAMVLTPDVSAELTFEGFHVMIQLCNLWPGFRKKHRKNCECCPLSHLIVREQRLSWIWVLNCKNCNQCLNCHKSAGLSRVARWVGRWVGM